MMKIPLELNYSNLRASIGFRFAAFEAGSIQKAIQMTTTDQNARIMEFVVITDLRKLLSIATAR